MSTGDRKSGPKRLADGNPKPIDTSSPIMSAFSYFRSELDEHHDRRERIIKASRDITAQAKKIIFSLQRHRILGKPLSPSVDSDVTTRKDEISNLLMSIAPDLAGELNRHRYLRQISPGLQELVEAAVFERYLTAQTLLSMEDLSNLYLPEPLRPVLTESDYLLGVYDATGEIMRFAITGMATGGAVPVGSDGERSVLLDLRTLRGALESLDTGHKASQLAREADKKAEVMRQSVEKVEAAVYGLIVRGKERPKGWIPDAKAEGAGREEVESY